MNIALKRRPSGVMRVMFQFNHSPANLVLAIREILQALGGLLGPIKMTKQHRIFFGSSNGPAFSETAVAFGYQSPRHAIFYPMQYSCLARVLY